MVGRISCKVSFCSKLQNEKALGRVSIVLVTVRSRSAINYRCKSYKRVRKDAKAILFVRGRGMPKIIVNDESEYQCFTYRLPARFCGAILQRC